MNIDFEKSNGLVPVIVQHHLTLQVLMLGYMNDEALETTRSSGHVTFYSRSKKRLWTKGETSGNHLVCKEVTLDCDGDTLLIKAEPKGPVCHTGVFTCFGEAHSKGFLYSLEQTIAERKENPSPKSYTSSLFAKGINKIAQKVGEEATELIIEAKDENQALFLNEAADLLFHFLVLLRAKGASLEDVEDVLAARSK